MSNLKAVKSFAFTAMYFDFVAMFYASGVLNELCETELERFQRPLFSILIIYFFEEVNKQNNLFFLGHIPK